MARKWLDNAFWENGSKKLLNCISETKDERGRIVRKVMKVKDSNDMHKECVEALGEKLIDENTEKRMVRKENEAEIEKQKHLEKQRAKKLEQLFEYKLETFEIPEIKSSTNRPLKSKLRRSKSIPEVNLYAMMIVKEGLENGT